ncbi:hypothetical protein DdX_17214 [Ditylenchus destructor]|uniref:Uncharacterized protein n=1 Tax=Ditylenchus destructor TaxID=166010 RepID=A0AAD4MP05_9BILA|nr:hypothetical protein DdX_17214 [Ditylenchus destructor]
MFFCIVSIGLLACGGINAAPGSGVREVDKTEVDTKKPESPDTQFLVQSGVEAAAFRKRADELASMLDQYYGSLQNEQSPLTEEHKRAGSVPSRNPYSWMAVEEKRSRNPYSWLAKNDDEKRSRNPYSWLATNDGSIDRTKTWGDAPPPPKRLARVGPMSWAEGLKRGAKNPYSWMNYA